MMIRCKTTSKTESYERDSGVQMCFVRRFGMTTRTRTRVLSRIRCSSKEHRFRSDCTTNFHPSWPPHLSRISIASIITKGYRYFITKPEKIESYQFYEREMSLSDIIFYVLHGRFQLFCKNVLHHFLIITCFFSNVKIECFLCGILFVKIIFRTGRNLRLTKEIFHKIQDLFCDLMCCLKYLS